VAPPPAEQSAALEPNALEVLAFVGPLLILPALIISQLIVRRPVLRREPATSRRRRAASVLAIVALIAAAPLLLIVWALRVFRFMLLAGILLPAGLTLTRLRQLPPPPPPSLTGAPHGP
jgi:hypothetical protein